MTQKILSSLIDNGFIVIGLNKDDKEPIQKKLVDMGHQFLSCRGRFGDKKNIFSLLIVDDRVNAVGDCIEIIKENGYDTLLYRPPRTLDNNAYVIGSEGEIVHSYDRISTVNIGSMSHTTIELTGESFSFYNKD